MAYLIKVTMPVTYFNRQCPGVYGSGCCVWSTEVVGEQALILSTSELCPICMVMQGLRGDVAYLQLHLANLYLLDIDQFQKAREWIGDDTFKEVQAAVLHTLTSGISSSKLVRGKHRKIRLARSLSLLMQGSWMLKCWGSRLVQDTYDINQYEAALCMFAKPIRGLIYEFVCVDVRKLCDHLCTVKRYGYYVLDQPIFLYSWQGVQEFNARNNYDHYLYIARKVHRPKLLYLKQILVKHAHFIKRNWVMQRRGVLVKRAIGLLDSMLIQKTKSSQTPSSMFSTVA